MATINQIRPMLNQMSYSERLAFITKYTGERQLDMDKANFFVRKAVAKEKVVREKKSLPKPNKAALLGLTTDQLALLAKLGVRV